MSAVRGTFSYGSLSDMMRSLGYRKRHGELVLVANGQSTTLTISGGLIDDVQSSLNTVAERMAERLQVLFPDVRISSPESATVDMIWRLFRERGIDEELTKSYYDAARYDVIHDLSLLNEGAYRFEAKIVKIPDSQRLNACIGRVLLDWTDSRSFPVRWQEQVGIEYSGNIDELVFFPRDWPHYMTELDQGIYDALQERLPIARLNCVVPRDKLSVREGILFLLERELISLYENGSLESVGAEFSATSEQVVERMFSDVVIDDTAAGLEWTGQSGDDKEMFPVDEESGSDASAFVNQRQVNQRNDSQLESHSQFRDNLEVQDSASRNSETINPATINSVRSAGPRQIDLDSSQKKVVRSGFAANLSTGHFTTETGDVDVAALEDVKGEIEGDVEAGVKTKLLQLNYDLLGEFRQGTAVNMSITIFLIYAGIAVSFHLGNFVRSLSYFTSVILLQ